MSNYYIVDHYKVRPVKILSFKQVCNGMFLEYRVQCLDGAEEILKISSNHLYDYEKDAIPVLLEQLDRSIKEHNERLEQLKNRKQEYERKFKNE